MESDWVSKAKLQPTAEAALWSLPAEDSAIYFLWLSDDDMTLQNWRREINRTLCEYHFNHFKRYKIYSQKQQLYIKHIKMQFRRDFNQSIITIGSRVDFWIARSTCPYTCPPGSIQTWSLIPFQRGLKRRSSSPRLQASCPRFHREFVYLNRFVL